MYVFNSFCLIRVNIPSVLHSIQAHHVVYSLIICRCNWQTVRYDRHVTDSWTSVSKYAVGPFPWFSPCRRHIGAHVDDSLVCQHDALGASFLQILSTLVVVIQCRIWHSRRMCTRGKLYGIRYRAYLLTKDDTKYWTLQYRITYFFAYSICCTYKMSLS